MRINTLVIVGVGLIGGSIALAARRRSIAARVVGVDRRAEVLACAVRDRLLDEAQAHLSTAAETADLLVFCTPVDTIAEQVIEAAAHCRPGALLTDTGSTKAAIVRAVRGHLPAGVEFIGSHPLAGSEKHGLAHASDQLLERRLVLVTPDPHPSLPHIGGREGWGNALSSICDFWTALGARVQVMDAEEHDRALAFTSHLPHLLSSALASILPPAWHDLVATGFRDTTRLASGQPSLWSPIFQANQAHLLVALDRFDEQLRRFRELLLHGDRTTLEALLQQAKKIRDDLAHG